MQSYMYTIALIAIFALGTIIGSFLNVVIYRFNTGKPISRGRSICMTCNKTLRWYELIPVFSFLIQSGKCRRCASTISHQYPSVELATGLLFAFLSLHFLPILEYSQNAYVLVLILFMFLFSLLVVITVYDLRHKIIPDALVYTYALFSFLSIFVNQTGMGSLFIKPSMWSLLAGPVLALPFALIWLLSRGRAMGLGDAKLILGIGWMLGISLGASALVISVWTGAVIGVLGIVLSKKGVSMKTEIPFAPFLMLGTLIAFFFHVDILSFASLFSV
jgi:prepilin signal peptidase PulO-like enzyme (type II secretory pathway)